MHPEMESIEELEMYDYDDDQEEEGGLHMKMDFKGEKEKGQTKG